MKFQEQPGIRSGRKFPIDGFLFRLYDTAGLRDSVDTIEKEGIKRSREAVRKADIVLFIGDVNVGFSSLIERDLAELNSSVRIVKVLNKIDLGKIGSYSEDFRISAISGLGIQELLNGIKNLALQDSSYSEKSAVVTNIRHYDCLKKRTPHEAPARSGGPAPPR